jgi:hypothetical protein
VSVHPDRGAWVVRWRDNGAQRARRFKTEAEALAFDEGVSGGATQPRSSTPNVYPLRDVRGDALTLQLPRLAREPVEQAGLPDRARRGA